MSFVLDFKASPAPGPVKFAMLFDLSRSLEPLSELLRGRGRHKHSSIDLAVGPRQALPEVRFFWV
jgi:hypothetical protein